MALGLPMVGVRGERIVMPAPVPVTAPTRRPCAKRITSSLRQRALIGPAARDKTAERLYVSGAS
ncbi:hypothetical protein THITH_12570 [Thioalkalivibrio paradoxus ARh 1]|uniref:Uncharacterized protein n=1 Tax=Thioalkalivibrio paradoxus ARh 1 TaxID=713585 RepID=W0DNR3_9GAMM|nr:hypothetical protein THITH_12570 [Thioalkalivibrio paradoxus ARh 1]